MKNKYKIILIICVIIGICSILVGSIAYYRIVVEGNIKASTGNAVFVLKDENSNVWNNKEINLGKVNPGDSGSFTVTMDASGSTVDMYATLELDRGTLPTNLKFYTTSDHKSELHKYYSFLEQNGTNSETLTIYWYWNPYIDDIEDSKFINVSNLEAKIRVSAVQISEYAMMKNGNGVTSSDRMYFWKDNYRPYIRTITFGNDLSNLPSECTEENLCFDVTSDGSKKKVYGYLIDSGLKDSNNLEQSLYNLYIVSEAPIFAPADCSLFFAGFNNLININYNNNFNTSKVTNMSYMFLPIESGDWSNDVVLTSSDDITKPTLLSKNNNFNTELMGAVSGPGFHSVLEDLNLSGFNTANVTSMKKMFAYCSQLTIINLSSFNTSNVTSMEDLFWQCKSLTILDLSSFNTSNVTDMSGMFYYCSALTSLDLSSFDTAKVTTMNSMFNECSSLTILDLSGFNTSKVTDMRRMFFWCVNLIMLDLSSFNTSSVVDMSYMFTRCSALTNLDLSSFNTSKVTSMEVMFSNCSSLISLDLSNFSTSNVMIMLNMFSGCSKLTTIINIIGSRVTNYSYMFSSAATDPNAKIVVNYTSITESLVDSMIATKSSNSNVVKGKQI